MEPPAPEASASAPLTAAVFHELIDELRGLEGRLQLPDVPLDEMSVLEGYKWIFTILAESLDDLRFGGVPRARFESWCDAVGVKTLKTAPKSWAP